MLDRNSRMTYCLSFSFAFLMSSTNSICLIFSFRSSYSSLASFDIVDFSDFFFGIDAASSVKAFAFAFPFDRRAASSTLPWRVKPATSSNKSSNASHTMSAVASELEVLPMLKLKPLAFACRQSMVFNFEMGRHSPMSQREGSAFDLSYKKTLTNPSMPYLSNSGLSKVQN
jgi:hypothetical protein